MTDMRQTLSVLATCQRRDLRKPAKKNSSTGTPWGILFGMSQWSEQTIARLSAAMRDRRKHLGLSAQEVSDRTAELGHVVSRSAIAAFENNQRGDRMMLTDALVLADALGTTLGLLLYPEQPDGDVDAAPNLRVDSFTALNWLTGSSTTIDMPASYANEDLTELTGKGRERNGGIELAQQSTKLVNVRTELVALEEDIATALDAGDMEKAQTLRAQKTMWANHADALKSRIEALGGVVNDG